MAYFPDQNDEIQDEDELQDGPSPIDTVAGPLTTRDQVMQRISGVRNPAGGAAGATSNTSSFDLGARPDGPDPARMQAAQQFEKNSALTSGIGRALNALSAGTGYKPDNSEYDSIEKQGQNAVGVAQTEAKNKQQMVKDWIAGKSKQAENAVNRDFRDRELQEQIKGRQQTAQIAAGAKDDAKAVKMAAAMKTDLDPNAGRAGNMGSNQKKVDQADRLLQLAEQGKGQKGGLDSRQMEEYAIGINSLLSNSSTGAASQVAALVPHTFWGKAQGVKEWLMNDPTGTAQQAFVQRMTDTVQREHDVASDQVKTAQIQRLPAHGALKAKDPETYNALLSSYGIDPASIQNGRYMPPKRQKAGGQPPAQDGSLIPSAMAGDDHGPKVGTVEDGFIYTGGDPQDPHSWAKAK